jgi:hypothetical protein
LKVVKGVKLRVGKKGEAFENGKRGRVKGRLRVGKKGEGLRVEKRGKVRGGKKGRLWVGEGETVNEGNREKG